MPGKQYLTDDEQATILIVDDVPKNLQVLGKMLKKENFIVSAAISGKQALDIIHNTSPHLILLDIMMPEMDGYEVCKILKDDEQFKNIPIIFLSAKTEKEDVIKGIKMGAVDYVTKPFNSTELLARINTHIELKRSQDKLLTMNVQLQKTLDEIDTLRGLIPICANCKQIRDDQGFWHHVETYISSHTLAQFSHGICPACMEKLYPDIYERLQKKQIQKRIDIGEKISLPLIGKNKIKEAKEFIENISYQTPKLVIVLGSGLGYFADRIKAATTIPSDEIPWYPKPTVAGHQGKLIFGEIGGEYILAVKGRSHYYEGKSLSEVTFPVQLFSSMGIKNIVLTNAAGGLNPEYHPGDFVLIKDFLNFTQIEVIPGVKIESPLSPKLLDIARQTAKSQNTKIKEGVYCWTTGPSYETAAEIQAVGKLGGDLVGMSTVPELLMASYIGMNVLGISLVTNLAAGIGKEPLSHEEVPTINHQPSTINQQPSARKPNFGCNEFIR